MDAEQKILIIDDERFNINVLIDILKPDYTTLIAKNGKQALKLAQTNQPDLILLDVTMPDMDGYEICRLLKEGGETKDIPVIFITARSEPEEQNKGYELGAVDYITKPFESSDVKTRVKTQIKAERKG